MRAWCISMSMCLRRPWPPGNLATSALRVRVVVCVAPVCACAFVVLCCWIGPLRMRTLLESHYNDLHYDKYLRKTHEQKHNERKERKKRKSDFKVSKSVVMAFKRKLCQRIDLLEEVKELLRLPKDETNLLTLEKLRAAILLVVQGVRSSTLDTGDERRELAAAICRATDTNHWNVIGPGVDWIRPGSWLHLDQNQADYINESSRKEERRDFLVQKLAVADPGLRIQVLTRPFASTDLAPPHGPFAKVLANWKKHKSLKECCRYAKPVPIPEDPQAVLDILILVLWDALHVDQCLRWSARSVCNLPVGHCLEFGRWFSMGLTVSKGALFSGICAMCRRFGCPFLVVRCCWCVRCCVAGKAPTCCAALWAAKSPTPKADRPSTSMAKL